jgi:hypothetical protein
MYEFLKKLPNINVTSSDWLIERNKFIKNKKAIRIAANQDHGLRTLEGESSSVLPNVHRIQHNEIRQNMIGIELERVEDTLLDQNVMENIVTEVNEK